MFAEVCRNPSEPSLIGELRRQAFGVAEMLEAGLVATQRPERVPQSKANVDGLLPHLTGSGKMGERGQRPFEVHDRIAIRRAGEGLGPALSEVGHCSVPQLAPKSVVSQLLDVCGQPLGIEALDGLDDATIEGA